MVTPLQDLSPLALVASIEDNQFAFWPIFASWLQVEMHDDAEMFWTISDMPVAMCNSVLRAQLAPDRLDSAIEVAITRCHARNVPMCWFVGPATRPADLGKRLETWGFTCDGNQVGMAVDLAGYAHQPPVTDLLIEQVSARSSETWGSAANRGFEMPPTIAATLLEGIGKSAPDPQRPLYNYLGYWNGAPVGTASLFLGAGVAGIYNVATVPEARRHGIGTAMTHAALQAAQTLGYRIAVLQSSPLGVDIYRRLGFQEYCTLSQYVWSNSAWVNPRL